MTARIVDLLEAVEIEVEHGMGAIELGRAGERTTQPLLELAPIDEPGERVVLRLMRQLRGVLALAR